MVEDAFKFLVLFVFMSPENQFSNVIMVLQENSETDLASRSPFLGGLFEVSGNVTFDISSFIRRLSGGEEREYVYSYPILSYSDTREEKIQVLSRTFGGFTLREGKLNSYRWVVKGVKAVELALTIEPYSPSRNNTIVGFQNWMNAESFDEKLAIAKEVRNQAEEGQNQVSLADYSDLVKLPSFMAGIIQARGSISYKKGLFKYLNISSTNTMLLDAIKGVYGGGIVGKSESRRLAISKNSARRLLLNASPYFINY